MINPDGVVVGNYRTNLYGLDLNRRWDSSKAKQTQEVIQIKKWIHENTRNREVSLVIDLHGHSRKYSSQYSDSLAFSTGIRGLPTRLMSECSRTSAPRIRRTGSGFRTAPFCARRKREKLRGSSSGSNSRTRMSSPSRLLSMGSSTSAGKRFTSLNSTTTTWGEFSAAPPTFTKDPRPTQKVWRP